MELFCPPTNITPSTIEESGIHVCKSKAYNGEKYLMPRIGSAKIKKLLKNDFNVQDDLFDLDYKGKGICWGYYLIKESFLIRIEAGNVFKIEGSTNTPLQDAEILDKICRFHGVTSTNDLKDVKQMRFFDLEEGTRFEKPKRTRNKNNSYSTEFYFKEIQSDILPTGEEKAR